ncbi:hypothetical protein AC629_38190 [Bradyrhizobium sp. NAS80.1]|nr:hypothetical protein AC629_38190 [Bradyrhizobium sp. NAS80.1]
MAGTINKEMLKSFADIDDVRNAAPIPTSLLDICDLRDDKVIGRDVWTLTPRDGGQDRTIFYNHGGGYVINITAAHWQYLEALCRATRAKIVVPDYPLAPDSTYEAAFSCIEAAFERVASETDPAKIVLMGDSAGGGLSLGFAQTLRDSGKPLPGQVFVLSNPDMDLVDDRDHVLGMRGLVQAGRAYAGSQDPRHHQISPIYGSFEGLPSISIFQGTHDIFVAESRKLVARLQREGLSVNYFEFPNQRHVWALFQTPESKTAIEKMVELIDRK